MKRDIETMSAILDGCISTTITNACKRCRVSVAAWYRWLALSADDPGRFTFAWGPFGEAPLHTHARTALRLGVFDLHDKSLDRARHGITEKLWFGGQPVWERDPRISDADAADVATCMLLWGQPDGFLRRNNELVQASKQIYSESREALMLRAHMPKQFNTTNQTMDVRHSGGVRVIGAPKPVEAPRLAPVEPPRLAPPIAPEQAMVTELEDLDKEALAAGYDPSDDIPDDVPEPPRPMHVQAPRPRPGYDAEMSRHGERCGAGEAEPGGMRVL